MGQTLNPPTNALTMPPTSASPCLSPIRYSLDLSSINQIQSANIEEEPIEIAQQPLHRSLPMDDGSVKVCISIERVDRISFVFFVVSVLGPKCVYWKNINGCNEQYFSEK